MFIQFLCGVFLHFVRKTGQDLNERTVDLKNVDEFYLYYTNNQRNHYQGILAMLKMLDPKRKLKESLPEPEFKKKLRQASQNTSQAEDGNFLLSSLHSFL